MTFSMWSQAHWLIPTELFSAMGRTIQQYTPGFICIYQYSTIDLQFWIWKGYLFQYKLEYGNIICPSVTPSSILSLLWKWAMKKQLPQTKCHLNPLKSNQSHHYTVYCSHTSSDPCHQPAWWNIATKKCMQPAGCITYQHATCHYLPGF